MKILLCLLVFSFVPNSYASICEVKSYDEFFAKNLDILVPSDSDNTPKSIRIKKSLFHYFIVGRDLPVEVKKDGKVIELSQNEISKYIWGVERRSPEKHELNVKNCVSKADLENLEKDFKVWRSKNMSALGNAIHDLDLVNVVKAIDQNKIYNKNGELDFRSIRMILRMNWEDAIKVLLSRELKLSKNIEPRLIEIGIELDNFELIEKLAKSKIDFDQILFNGLKPLGYSLIRMRNWYVSFSYRILNLIVETGQDMYDIDGLGNSNGVYQFLETAQFSGGVGCSFYSPPKMIVTQKEKRLILNQLPAFLKLRDQECLSKLKLSAARLGIEFPNTPELRVEDLPEYRSIARTARELDLKHDQSNEFNHNLTDEEYKWRSFVTQAYGIRKKLPRAAYENGFNPNSAEGKKIIENGRNNGILLNDVLITDPKTGKQFCKLDVYWDMIIKLRRRVDIKGECPNWKKGDSVYSKVIEADLSEKYSDMISNSIVNEANGNYIFEQLLGHPVPYYDYSSIVLRELASKISPNEGLDKNKFEKLIKHLLIKGYLENLVEWEHRLRYPDLFRGHFAKIMSSEKWYRDIDHSLKLYLMKDLGIYRPKLISSKQNILSSAKIQFQNGKRYYLCGRYSDVFGYDENRKKTKFIIPFCLKKFKCDEEGAGDVYFVSGNVYNVDDEYIALGMESTDVTDDQYQYQYDSYKRFQRLYVAIDPWKYKRIIYLKRSEISTPYVLTDGNVSIGLSELSFLSLKIRDRKFSYNHNDVNPGADIIPYVELIRTEVDDRLPYETLPKEFDVDKARILNHLPIDKFDGVLCGGC